MRSQNPATGEIIREYEAHSAAEVERRLALAQDTYTSWREIPIQQRAAAIEQLGAVLRQRESDLARLMTLEMGKPIVQSEQEVQKCADTCFYLAKHGSAYLEPEKHEGALVRFDPLGPILGVMPWNFPLWQVYRFAVPALLAGNVCLLKHASNVTGCALAIEESFRAAGFIDGAFQVLLIPGAEVEKVVRSSVIRGVSLTGSEPAGRAVARAAGDEVKKTVLELGGSDPFVVLQDADIESVARSAAKARTINSGQSCVAAKRFIVERVIAASFEEKFAKEVAALVVGDPLDRKVQIGPLARPDLLDELDRQVRDSMKMGAKVLTGGERREGPGNFYLPTVLGSCTRDMPVCREETFGPVAAVISVEGEREAIECANDTPFGLGASIWTRDLERGKKLAEKVDSGLVFINDIVRSIPNLPFGGVKRSGYGRELSQHGVREFTNIKTVWFNG